MICNRCRTDAPTADRSRRRLSLIVAFLTAVCIAGASAAPLPEAALNRAREAEKLFGAGQPKEAIAIYEKLDKEFPGQNAINYRLAQLHDLANNAAPSLFYYRRYLSRAGDSAREEARDRAAALELSLGVAEAATRMAQERKETAVAVATPNSPVRHSVAAMTSDGILRPLTGPQDVDKLARGEEIPAETPAPPMVVFTPESRVPLRQQNAPVTPVANAAGSPAPPTTAAAPRPATPQNASLPSSPSTGVAARPPVASLPDQDEDAALAAAFSRRTAGDTAPLLSPASSRSVIRLPDRRPSTPPTNIPSDSNADMPLSMPLADLTISDFAPATSPRASATPVVQPLVQELAPSSSSRVPSLSALEQAVAAPPPVRQMSRVAPSAAGTATSTKPAAGAAFFSTKAVGGNQAQLRISNTIPDSLLTLAAIPEFGGTPINALVAPGESRSYNLPPGTYEVAISAATNDYPPRSLLDRRFEQDFLAGHQYTRRLTPGYLQGIE